MRNDSDIALLALNDFEIEKLKLYISCILKGSGQDNSAYELFDLLYGNSPELLDNFGYHGERYQYQEKVDLIVSGYHNVAQTLARDMSWKYLLHYEEQYGKEFENHELHRLAHSLGFDSVKFRMYLGYICGGDNLKELLVYNSSRELVLTDGAKEEINRLSSDSGRYKSHETMLDLLSTGERHNVLQSRMDSILKKMISQDKDLVYKHCFCCEFGELYYNNYIVDLILKEYQSSYGGEFE